jgi:tRNA threonylcarbamoyl adenosine modification protein YeaZ
MLKAKTSDWPELFDYKGQYIIRFKIMSNTELKANLEATIILAIDTSSPEMRLATSRNVEGNVEKIIASLTIQDDRPHSQTLFSNISTLLRLSGAAAQDIRAFAVSTGPGGFTGVRVGLAAVKGLADSLSKPICGVNTLDLFALASGFQGAHIVMIDAGRGEIYCGFREVVSGEIIESRIYDRVGKPLEVLGDLRNSLKENLKYPPLIIANGVKFQLAEIEDILGGSDQPILINPSFRIVDALVQHAASYLKKNQNLSVKPHYIRQSDAEMKWKEV